MKNFLYILLALILISSCSKEAIFISCIDPSTLTNPKLGTSTANTDFLDWNAITSCYFSPYDSNRFDIRIGIANLNNCDLYEITFMNVSLEKKKVNLTLPSNPNKLSARFTIWHGGDAIAEQYVLADNYENYINLSEVDENKVMGGYQLAFIVSPESVGRGLYDPSLPDTLKFNDGIFTVPLPK